MELIYSSHRITTLLREAAQETIKFIGNAMDEHGDSMHNHGKPWDPMVASVFLVCP